MSQALLLLLGAAFAHSTTVGPHYFKSLQDHFQASNFNTWNQAYYVNDTFWKGGNAPVFLCVGGEGPQITEHVVSDSVHCNVAVEWLEETGAIMFAVEHRYYGCHNRSACPVDDLDAPDALKFLSSKQAHMDLAAFHKFASKAYNISYDSKWITWGGSYPGMLAGWARILHPTLFHASVASSAPVRAELDMRGYNNHVANAYAVSDNGVGGSLECKDNIAQGHAFIGKLMETKEGRAQLVAQFHLLHTLDNLQDRKNFAGNGVAGFYPQGNDPSCTSPACDIGSQCKVMLDDSLGDNVARLAKLAKLQGRFGLAKQTKRTRTRTRMGDDYVTVLANRETSAEPDYWTYQTCTEFGFYQTCEVGSDCFYTQGLILLDDFLEMCKPYNLNKSQVAENIKKTNEYYGALTPNGSNVLYPNGEVDPWAANGITKGTSSLPAFLVKGSSHHAWTHPTLPTDQESIVQARLKIKKQVKVWLGEIDLQ